MKISNSKKQLAQLLIEAGVTKFPEGSDWAAQGRIDLKASFYGGYKPKRGYGETAFCGNYCGSHHDVQLPTLIQNWHQSVLSRDEFDQIVAKTIAQSEPDADGWIEWTGGECPCPGASGVARRRDGKEIDFSEGEARCWSHGKSCMPSFQVVAYRIRKPAEPTVAAPERIIIEKEPTIEQLAADYRNAKDCAERKQQEADAAKDDADAKLAELVAAGKAIGLALGVEVAEPELVITDFRDLRVGDEISVQHMKNVYSKSEVLVVGNSEVAVRNHAGARKTVNLDAVDWKFIRRP